MRANLIIKIKKFSARSKIYLRFLRKKLMLESTVNLTNYINNFKKALFGMIIDFFLTTKKLPNESIQYL